MPNGISRRDKCVFDFVCRHGHRPFCVYAQVPLLIQADQLTLTSASVVAALNYLGYLCGSFDAMRAQQRVEWRLHLGGLGRGGVNRVVSLCRGPPAARDHSFCDWLGQRLGHGAGGRVEQRATASSRSSWSVGGGLCRSRRWHFHQRPAGGHLTLFTGLCDAGVGHFTLRWPPCWWRPSAATCRVRGAAPGRAGTSAATLTPNLRRLVLSYSLAGFGYILPATFLSQMAAARFPGSALAQLVWPVFGGAAMLGIVIGIVTRRMGQAHVRLAITLWAQALGVLAAAFVAGVRWFVTWCAAGGRGLF